MPNPFKRARWYHKISNLTAAPMFRLGPMPRGFLLLTVTGRKTGRRRHRPIRAIRDGDVYYAVAVLGERSDWLRNVRKNPGVQAKIGRQTVDATAREVTDPAERERAAELYTETVVPYDRVDYPMVDWGIPTSGQIRKAHREWLEHGRLVAIQPRDARK